MPDNTLFQFVNEFGYLAIFLLVFLQEIGVPNPVPNELVLIFAGALTTIGDLSVWLVLLMAVSADIIGTTALYLVFYFFEKVIMERIPKWIPIDRHLERFKKKILHGGRLAIFIGRLMPYLRGYISVAAGVLNVSYKVFIPMAVLSAVLWTGGYVILGHFLGRQWEEVAEFIGRYQWMMLVALVAGVGIWVFARYRKKRAAPAIDNGQEM